MSATKKILIFNYTFFAISETFLYQQVQSLSKENEVSLLSYTYLNEDKFPVTATKYVIKPFANIWDKITTRIIQSISHENLHLSAFNRVGVRRTLRKAGTEVIHAHFGSSGVAILPVAKSLRIPLVVTFHGIDAAPAMLKNENYSRHINELLDYAKAIIIVSPHMIETLDLNKYISKVSIIPCSVDFSLFQRSSKKLSEDDGVVRILHSGRLVGKKGVPDLIEVILRLSKKYKNIQLTVVGDGPEMEQCKKLTKKTEARILLEGSKSHEFVKRAMNETDIFVLNCRTDDHGDMEGMPVSILEAMSMELPVVSSYHAGIPQAITSGENGLLISERNNEELYTALERLICDPELRVKLGENARKTIIEKFGLEQSEQKIERLLL